ncbi:hypothetical protein [Shimia sp.]|uniref:phage nozzle protein n=1 Tax=Shimia sp. TaxID=1954381 RepID=UPI003BACECC4
MLIASSIPNLINGISQQPPTLRLASQAEEQVNFLSSVADGLTMRPPTRFLAQVDNSDWSDGFIHTINRDINERYVVVIRSGRLRVFEAETGIERTVNAPHGWGYLSGSGKADFRAVTVADYTFVLNRNKTVRASSAKTPRRVNQSMVYVRGGNYGKTYRVFINGAERASFTTPDGDNANQASAIDTNNIAAELLSDLKSWGGSGFSFSRKGDLILIKRNDATKFSVRVEDGVGGTNIDAIQSQVQRFSDLPKNGIENFEVEIVGDQSSSFDNYFVRYETEGNDGVGVWKEFIKGGETYKLDPVTMPHTLVREANGTFTFGRPAWAPREVGDLDKVPHPSFEGRPIRDIFFFQNRLGFVADENVIMSQDGEYFDFYRATATTTLDTDPIDIATTSERVSIINFAVPFNRTLLLFSDQSQFVLEGGGVLTPSTVAIAQSTAFESLPNVRPVGVGQFVYFPVPRGGSSGLREYFVQEGNEQNDALDVTSHCPRYLPRGMKFLAASSAEDTMVMLAEEEKNSIWVYRFFFNNEGKLQSAWSKWVLSDEDHILSAEFIESNMYLVISRRGKTFLEVINFESGTTDTGSSVLFRVDRGVPSEDCTRVKSGDYTTFTLPYETNDELHVVVRGDDPNFPEGTIITYDRPAPNKVRLRGDWTNAKLMLGSKFVARYKFSTFYMRTPEPAGGVSANSDGRLQLRYVSVDYSRAGFFKIRSHPRGRAVTERTFSGRKLGIASGTIGQMNLATGRVRIPVMCRNHDANIEIICDSPLPASFTAAEWEATYNSRARKV